MVQSGPLCQEILDIHAKDIFAVRCIWPYALLCICGKLKAGIAKARTPKTIAPC